MKLGKYGNRKTVVGGYTFDSALEARRYQELRLMERAGEIRDLRLQPSYELLPAFRKNGKFYRKVTYIADFSYYDTREQRCIVEDTKGFRTDVYKIKQKLFEYKYPNLTIKEITK